MPTEEETIDKYGKKMWDKMCKSGWLDGITVRIISASVLMGCKACGHKMTIKTSGNNIRSEKTDCPECKGKKSVEFIEILDFVSDIPQSDIDRAYRAANGEVVGSWEMD